jgi:hypothetical protein
LVADWLDLVVALVTPVLRPCRSCRGKPTFGKTAVGGLLSSSPGSGLPRWNRQPAAGIAGPPSRAGLHTFKPWRLMGCQPASSSARGMPHKSHGLAWGFDGFFCSPKSRLFPSKSQDSSSALEVAGSEAKSRGIPLAASSHTGFRLDPASSCEPARCLLGTCAALGFDPTARPAQCASGQCPIPSL